MRCFKNQKCHLQARVRPYLSFRCFLALNMHVEKLNKVGTCQIYGDYKLDFSISFGETFGI